VAGEPHFTISNICSDEREGVAFQPFLTRLRGHGLGKFLPLF
jgi:hypothetical protein